MRANRRVAKDRRPPPVYASIKNRVRRGFAPVKVKDPAKYLHRRGRR